ncbi:IS66 family insertion sequence element accessory protein TnpB [Bradyrhizobium neotropicale]|uniref:IS66 family insertion sequence element accessory protein TnpB n=1 Tax=Bradyrhizobium neotropicale TaxID=1497615 RepID=UPI0009EE6ED4
MIAAGSVDCRKDVHGPAAQEVDQLHHAPFRGIISVFRSKSADRLKILAWTARPRYCSADRKLVQPVTN